LFLSFVVVSLNCFHCFVVYSFSSSHSFVFFFVWGRGLREWVQFQSKVQLFQQQSQQ
jgi:hypothetical protein